MTITPTQCSDMAALIASDVSAQAEAVGARMINEPARVSCSSTTIKVCGVFFSDADGALLQGWIEEQVKVWLEVVTNDATGEPGSCPSYLLGYSVGVFVGGDGPDPQNLPASCLDATAITSCKPASVAFPKCK